MGMGEEEIVPCGEDNFGWVSGSLGGGKAEIGGDTCVGATWDGFCGRFVR